MPSPNIVSYIISSGVGTSAFLPLPTGVSSGNFLLGLFRSNNTGLHNVPTGWTQLGSELEITTHNQTINAGMAFYKTASNSEPPGYNISFESGKYVGLILNINQTTGIDAYKAYTNRQSCISCVSFGQRVRYTGELQLNVIGGLSPFIGSNYIGGYEAPFNGMFHSGVSLYVNTGVLPYSSTGVYAPPYSMSRASGTPFQNSGGLYIQPPSLYYFGLSLGLKP